MKARFGISVLFAVLLSSFHAFYSIPRCEAAVAPVRMVWLVVAIAGSQTSAAAIMPGRIAQIAVIAMPQSCEAGVMEQLCSSVTNFLNEESAKADADAKACKKNCGWKKRKDDLLDAAKKKAKESCAKGEAPDAQELSKGLDRNTKDRLKDLYDRNSRMFDGTAKLAAKDLEPVPSNSAATLTGKGGQITDLKSSEPDTPKLSCTSEFCLAGKSNTLVASAKNSDSAQNAEAASVKTVLSPQKVQAAKPKCGEGSAFCPGQKPCSESKKCESTMGDGYWPNDCIKYAFCGTPDEGGEGGGTKKPGFWDRLMGRTEPCGKSWYNKSKECCVNGKRVKKCDGECYNPAVESCENRKREKKDAEAIKKYNEEANNVSGPNGEVPLAETVCTLFGGFKFQKKPIYDYIPCGIKKCTDEHENAHINDIKGKYPKSCQGRGGKSPDIPMDFYKEIECRAHLNVYPQCLDKKLAEDISDACRGFIQKQRQNSILIGVKKYNCP